jgi:hypothetical protein
VIVPVVMPVTAQLAECVFCRLQSCREVEIIVSLAIIPISVLNLVGFSTTCHFTDRLLLANSDLVDTMGFIA